MSRRQSETGAALLLVLWLVAAMSLMVMGGTQSGKRLAVRVADELDRIRVTVLLDGALSTGAQKLVQDQRPSAVYRLIRMRMGGQLVWLEVIPAGGLVDPSIAKPALLVALLERVGGLSPAQAVVMAARISDFIDPDDIPNDLGGAEAAQYRAAGRTVLPRNAAIQDIAELLDVLGMRADVYEKIREYLTTNGSSIVDIKAAPPELIDALTGQTGLGQRLHSDPSFQASVIGALGAASEYFQGGPSLGGLKVKLNAFAYAGDGLWWRREWWVDLRSRSGSTSGWSTLTVEPIQRVRLIGKDIRP